MALKRNVSLLAAARYHGGGPMLSWFLHRIGGLAMVIFVGMHILSSYMQYFMTSELGTTINIIYESVYFQVVLYFFVIFHALNGLRIIILDIWPGFLKFQREATWMQWLIFIPVYGLAVFLMVSRAISGA